MSLLEKRIGYGALRRAFRGLVRAGRMWSEELDVHIENEGFTATVKYPVIYIKTP